MFRHIMAIKSMARHSALFENKYVLGRFLGIGATSDVYECYKRDTSVKFAAKKSSTFDIYKFNHSKKEEHYLEILSNHENICSLHDLFYEKNEDDGFVKYMVTECGVNTLGHLASNVYINEDNLKHFVRQMLMSIMHCHNNNICHRDIKLENFIYTNSYNLSPESPLFLNTMNIKLIDFGLATNFHKDYNLKGRVGTVSYVAPEILTYHSYTSKIDAWSLGVSIYKLIIKNPVIKHTKIESFKPAYNNKNWNNYSMDCHDFVKQLLTINYDNRMSIKDALNHQWITVS